MSACCSQFVMLLPRGNFVVPFFAQWQVARLHVRCVFGWFLSSSRSWLLILRVVHRNWLVFQKIRLVKGFPKKQMWYSTTTVVFLKYQHFSINTCTVHTVESSAEPTVSFRVWTLQYMTLPNKTCFLVLHHSKPSLGNEFKVGRGVVVSIIAGCGSYPHALLSLWASKGLTGPNTCTDFSGKDHESNVQSSCGPYLGQHATAIESLKNTTVL